MYSVLFPLNKALLHNGSVFVGFFLKWTLCVVFSPWEELTTGDFLSSPVCPSSMVCRSSVHFWQVFELVLFYFSLQTNSKMLEAIFKNGAQKVWQHKAS